MDVNIKITFSAEEIRAMVQAKLTTVQTVVPGRFVVDAAYGYIPDIRATFVPEEDTVCEAPALAEVA